MIESILLGLKHFPVDPQTGYLSFILFPTLSQTPPSIPKDVQLKISQAPTNTNTLCSITAKIAYRDPSDHSKEIITWRDMNEINSLSPEDLKDLSGLNTLAGDKETLLVRDSDNVFFHYTSIFSHEINHSPLQKITPHGERKNPIRLSWSSTNPSFITALILEGEEKKELVSIQKTTNNIIKLQAHLEDEHHTFTLTFENSKIKEAMIQKPHSTEILFLHYEGDTITKITTSFKGIPDLFVRIQPDQSKDPVEFTTTTTYDYKPENLTITTTKLDFPSSDIMKSLTLTTNLKSGAEKSKSLSIHDHQGNTHTFDYYEIEKNDSLRKLLFPDSTY